MKEFTIGPNDAGQRLDRFVSKAVPSLPPSLAQKYIRTKRVKVNARGARRETRLMPGDTVQMYVNDEFFAAPAEENAYLRVAAPKLDIVYEDGNILLLSKPAGMLCHSDGGYSYNTLVAHLQAYLYAAGAWDPHAEHAFAPALCNRIDRNTSGIVIAAKNAEALRILNEKIKNREIDKYYLAVVHGAPHPPAGTLTGYLFKDAVKNRVYVSDKSTAGSKTAVTGYRTLASGDGLSLLECTLLTGRTHQIRAQLAAAGHPLLGDGKYGRAKPGEAGILKGQALCSYRLRFSFKTGAGILDYLAGHEYRLAHVGFVEKYFNTIDI